MIHFHFIYIQFMSFKTHSMFSLHPCFFFCVYPGGKGTAVPFVCRSGEAAAGEAGAGGAQEAEARGRARKGGHILTFCLKNSNLAANYCFAHMRLNKVVYVLLSLCLYLLLPLLLIELEQVTMAVTCSFLFLVLNT